jgi:hypothetical protein
MAPPPITPTFRRCCISLNPSLLRTIGTVGLAVDQEEDAPNYTTSGAFAYHDAVKKGGN